ncbi:SDR family oxidoreductase [Nesterenkonia alkaliphila]|uniref:SDR family NAD(P)-dependent oxidoreductase n=1 Tax=Nesterenkonia alkaliphila TaxID=1463631 RepID=A0A7K1UJX8_9MICC|nr:NAD(P)-dependent oxidoreductase [Nesterenkonia alkaliphila]MVT26779.1 SDR family NAD(P)-dependent oxidoreductase [Nesterenkonia alkaliphila]GFZ77328.1 short chain dehydrogenase [Nesterenkonia alkaliphila]
MTQPTASLASKTVLISGGSRGIGHAIAVKLAAAGANIVLLAKTDQPHPTLPGTVHTAVADVEAAGGQGLAIVGDIRNDEDITRAVDSAVERFGGIDAVVNNASAIDLRPAEHQDMKRYDLMQDINARGSFALSRAAIPHLRASAQQSGWDPKILTLSPPINLDPKWFAQNLGYTMSKYAMSMTTIGLAAELASAGVKVNSLWPVTLIATEAVRNIPGGKDLVPGARRPQIVAEAAYALITGEADLDSGTFLTDEQVLRETGITDFSDYAVDPSAELLPDFFL